VIGLLLAGLALGAELTGTVTDDDGFPLSGAYVAAYDISLRQVGVDGPTGPDGRYAVQVPPGRIRLRVVPGNSLDRVEAWVPGVTTNYCEATVFDVVDEASSDEAPPTALGPGLSGTGVLLGPDGEPLVGAEVEARPLIGSSAGIQPRRAITTSDGRFTVVGLPPDRVWALRVDAEGLPRQWVGGAYDSLSGVSVGGQAGERVDVGTHTLLPGITVSGQVSGPDGPLPEAVVTAYSEGQLTADRADVDGRYTLSGLPPGALTAWVDADGHARVYWPDSVLPGERLQVDEEGTHVQDFDLQAPLEAIVQGQLQGQGQLEGINVLLTHTSGALGLGTVTDADGAFTIREVPPGTWTLRVRAEEQGFVSGPIGGEDDPDTWTTVEGQTTRLTGSLDPAVTLAGVVLGADGEPALDGLVSVRSRSTDRRYETLVLPDGSFVVGGLPGGDTWDLWAEGNPPCPNDPDRVRIYYPDTPDFLARIGLALDAGDRVDWTVRLPDDADRDAMDDAWEQDVGLDPTRRDADQDPDGDGASNLVEYWEDTDPLAPPGRCASTPLAPLPWAVGLAGLVTLGGRRRRLG